MNTEARWKRISPDLLPLGSSLSGYFYATECKSDKYRPVLQKSSSYYAEASVDVGFGLATFGTDLSW